MDKASTNNRPGVLIVEDTREIAEMVSEYLADRDYSTYLAANVYQAKKSLKEHHIDVIVLDWMLPGPPGTELLVELVSQSRTRPGVILLTARSEEKDVVYGLNAGADDYVTKPFSLAELHARIKRLVRSGPANAGLGDSGKEFAVGMARINPRTAKIDVDGAEIKLSETVFRLLVFFHNHPNTIHSRRDLLKVAWPAKVKVSDRTVDVHISHLRKFLKTHCGVDALHTVRQEGYKFVLDD